MTRRARRAVDGVLLLDKPLGLSSNNALQRVKRLYNAERAGHSGTLDPLATGLLPILLGEATKFGGGLLDSDKRYLAHVVFGVRTTTGDAEGEVIATAPVDVSRATLEAVLERFRGAITQVPPMYSALKRDGKPLYEYARAGETIERAPRQVTIHALRLESFDGRVAVLDVECSKGTYIRTLGEDIGDALGCGAHLGALRRTGAGRFGIDDIITLEALESMTDAQRDARLLPVDAPLADLPSIVLDTDAAARFGHGRIIAGAWPTAGRVRVYDPDGRFLGVGDATPAGELQPRRLMREASPQTCEER